MRYEARAAEGSSYVGKRAYVYDLVDHAFVTVFHRSEAYPDPLAAAEAEARRLSNTA